MGSADHAQVVLDRRGGGEALRAGAGHLGAHADAQLHFGQFVVGGNLAVVSQLVVVVKDTALGGILVGYVELRRAANTSASNYGNLLPTYIVVAVIYIVINLLLSSLSTYLERKLRTRRGGKRVEVTFEGETDLLGRQDVSIVDVPGIDEIRR